MTECGNQPEVSRLRAYRDHDRKIHALLIEFLEIEGLLEWWPAFVQAKITGSDYRAMREREGWAVRRMTGKVGCDR